MNIEETDIFSMPDELGIEPFVPGESQLTTVEPEPAIQATVDDTTASIDTAERNVTQIYEKGKKAIDDLYKIASSSDDPRVYRVLSEMITSVAAVNRDLFEIQKIKNASKIPTTNGINGPTINNNALIVGTTADINKILESLNIKTKPLIEMDEEYNNASIEDS